MSETEKLKQAQAGMTQNYKLSRFLADQKNLLGEENSILAVKNDKLIKLSGLEKYSRELEKTLID